MTSKAVKEKNVRKNINTLTDEELHRLRVAMYLMQTSGDWVLCAGIHGGGLPNVSDVKVNRNKAWCHHRKETFPIWHRPYLWEFEQMLRKHDPNPEKGKLTLPYWDWTDKRPNAINGIPDAFLVERVALTIKGKKITVINPLYSGPSKEHSISNNGSRTFRGKFNKQYASSALKNAYDALTEDNFPEFASKDNPVSIESPHGAMHVAVGGDMGDVGRAAFDPIFWFHHNNVERLLYNFQKKNPKLKSKIPLDKQVLDPFPPRALHENGQRSWQNNSEKYTSANEWWNISTLDYTFDILPEIKSRENQLRDRRRYLVFWDVPHPMQTVQLKIFIRLKGSPKRLYPPSQEEEDPSFAGAIIIFSFNRFTSDSHCEECDKQEEISYTLEIGTFLDSIDVRTKKEVFDRVDIDFKIQDSNGEDLDEIKTFKKKLPKPDILWENEFIADSIDISKLEDSSQRDIKQLKKFLEYYGYVSGSGSKNLNDALRKFQEAWGLKSDGILGPITQEFISRPRSANSDTENDCEPVLLNFLKESKYKFLYTVTQVDDDLVDVNTPDLGLSKVIHVLDNALQAWSKPLSQKIGHTITFEYVDPEHDNIDLEIRWELFDGIGGTLGYASGKKDNIGACSIQLDSEERWTLDNKLPYSLQPVVVHELGHLFGLKHINKESSIMFPYYRPEELVPSKEDIENVVKLAGISPVSTSPISDSEEYIVSIVTGTKYSAGTNAKVFFQLFGSSGETEVVNIEKGQFARGNTHVHKFSAKNIGSLTKIRLGHDNGGIAPGWYVDNVSVKCVGTGEIYNFPINNWFDKKEGDVTRKIVRDINVQTSRKD